MTFVLPTFYYSLVSFYPVTTRFDCPRSPTHFGLQFHRCAKDPQDWCVHGGGVAETWLANRRQQQASSGSLLLWYPCLPLPKPNKQPVTSFSCLHDCPIVFSHPNRNDGHMSEPTGTPSGWFSCHSISPSRWCCRALPPLLRLARRWWCCAPACLLRQWRTAVTSLKALLLMASQWQHGMVQNGSSPLCPVFTHTLHPYPATYLYATLGHFSACPCSQHHVAP